MRINFDLTSTKEYSGSSPLLDPGRYLVEISDQREERNKAGNGTVLAVTYLVIEGPNKGCTVREWINFDNPSSQSVEIARTQLKSLGIACNKPVYADTLELSHIPFFITVLNEEDKNNKLRNVVKSYSPRSVPSGVAQLQANYQNVVAQVNYPQQNYQQQDAAQDVPFWQNQGQQ